MADGATDAAPSLGWEAAVLTTKRFAGLVAWERELSRNLCKQPETQARMHSLQATINVSACIFWRGRVGGRESERESWRVSELEGEGVCLCVCHQSSSANTRQHYLMRQDSSAFSCSSRAWNDRQSTPFRCRPGLTPVHSTAVLLLGYLSFQGFQSHAGLRGQTCQHPGGVLQPGFSGTHQTPSSTLYSPLNHNKNNIFNTLLGFRKTKKLFPRGI